MGRGGLASVCLVCGRLGEDQSTCFGEEYVHLGASLVCQHTYRLLASSPLYYTTAPTALFESIAMIVDQHQPVVEKYYGPGKMASVLQRLLQESDKVVKDLIEGWEEERSIERKVRLANPIIPFHIH